MFFLGYMEAVLDVYTFRIELLFLGYWEAVLEVYTVHLLPALAQLAPVVVFPLLCLKPKVRVSQALGVWDQEEARNGRM